MVCFRDTVSAVLSLLQRRLTDYAGGACAEDAEAIQSQCHLLSHYLPLFVFLYFCLTPCVCIAERYAQVCSNNQAARIVLHSMGALFWQQIRLITQQSSKWLRLCVVFNIIAGDVSASTPISQQLCWGTRRNWSSKRCWRTLFNSSAVASRTNNYCKEKPQRKVPDTGNSCMNKQRVLMVIIKIINVKIEIYCSSPLL